MISVIICSIDPQKFERICRNYAERLASEPFEIIGIHDACSLYEGYNRGIGRSRGSILIFSHDDIEILSPDFRDSLKQHLSNHDIIGVSGTTCLINGGWISAGHPDIHGHVIHVDAANDGYIVDKYRNRLGGRNPQPKDILTARIKTREVALRLRDPRVLVTTSHQTLAPNGQN